MTLVPFFLLKISHNPTISALIKHLYLKTSRKIFGVSYIIIK
jgi:hypothetical protein